LEEVRAFFVVEGSTLSPRFSSRHSDESQLLRIGRERAVSRRGYGKPRYGSNAMRLNGHWRRELYGYGAVV